MNILSFCVSQCVSRVECLSFFSFSFMSFRFDRFHFHFNSSFVSIFGPTFLSFHSKNLFAIFMLAKFAAVSDAIKGISNWNFIVWLMAIWLVFVAGLTTVTNVSSIFQLPEAYFRANWKMSINDGGCGCAREGRLNRDGSRRPSGGVVWLMISFSNSRHESRWQTTLPPPSWYWGERSSAQASDSHFRKRH